jgi:membrane associated rhomboid family serine protease
MIPLRDKNPSRTIPFVNYVLIILNIIIFLFEISLGKGMEQFIYTFGVVPSYLMNDIRTLSIDVGTVIPFLTSMFLHGGWMHLLGNMLFLYVFGDNVEDRLGHWKYFIFYLIAGIAAAASQVFVSPNSQIPMVGASGAIAGVLGSYIILFPRARVLTLIPIFIFFQVIELPAFLFLGIWFLMQIISGTFALGIGADAGGVAWWAHIGGFVSGIIMLPFLKKR